MNAPLIESYRKVADIALGWFLQQINDDGSYGSAINDLACYYKSPYVFYLSGRLEEAKRILKHIQQTFMQANGDFKTTVDKKSENGAFVEYCRNRNLAERNKLRAHRDRAEQRIVTGIHSASKRRSAAPSEWHSAVRY